jgi:hypothetical protein
MSELTTRVTVNRPELEANLNELDLKVDMVDRHVHQVKHALREINEQTKCNKGGMLNP